MPAAEARQSDDPPEDAGTRTRDTVVPQVPANIAGSDISLRRPITLLVAFVYATVAFILSLFYSITRITPPDCSCSSSEPRTRPRPRPSPTPTPTPTLRRRKSALEQFSTVVAESSRHLFAFAQRRRTGTAGLPPPHRRLRGVLPHDLDNVGEEEEEEKAEEDFYNVSSDSAPNVEDEPALVVDDHSESDPPSEADTVPDEPKKVFGCDGKKSALRRRFSLSPRRSASEGTVVDLTSVLPSSDSSSTPSLFDTSPPPQRKPSRSLPTRKGYLRARMSRRSTSPSSVSSSTSSLVSSRASSISLVQTRPPPVTLSSSLSDPLSSPASSPSDDSSSFALDNEDTHAAATSRTRVKRFPSLRSAFSHRTRSPTPEREHVPSRSFVTSTRKLDIDSSGRSELQLSDVL